MRIRGICLALTLAACGSGLHSDPAGDANAPTASALVSWKLHDAATAVPLLCEPAETIDIAIGSAHAIAPCAPQRGDFYPSSINIKQIEAPLGTQHLRIELVGSDGVPQGVLEQDVSIVEVGGNNLGIDVPVTAHGTIGALALAWDLTSPDGNTHCGGALRESMAFDTNGASATIPALHWTDAGILPPATTGGVLPFSVLIPSVPIGAHVVSAKLMNTQAGTVEAQTTLHATAVGGRTAVGERFVFSNCPY